MAAFPFIFLAVLQLTSVAYAAVQAPVIFSQLDTPGVIPVALVALRIEGPEDTIFDGTVSTTPHDISTFSSRGTHHCDGTNGGAHPTPGATATTALDDASRGRFNWDATFNSSFDDFFITSIDGIGNQTGTNWGFAVNFQPSSVGGCQRQVQTGDQILWAFGFFTKKHFLILNSPSTGHINVPIIVSVTDASNGMGIPDAHVVVNGTVVAVTNAIGFAQVTFFIAGLSNVKASRPDSVRSSVVRITIS